MTPTTDAAPPRPHGVVLALTLLVCFATAFVLATPGFVLLMAARWGYASRQLGLFVTADSVGSALGPLLLSGLLSRLPVRRVIAVAALCLAAGNLVTALHPAFDAILAARLVAGASSGVLAALGVRCLALAANPERNLAWMTIGQTLYSSLLLTVVLPAVAGAPAAFGLLAAQALLCLGTTALFAPAEPVTAVRAGHGTVQRAGALLCLLAVLSLNTSVGIVWTFLGHQGMASGLDDALVDRVLGAANLLSIAGCAWVPFAVRRGWLFGSGVAALALCVVAVLALALPPLATRFVVASIVFVIAWAAAITLMMTALPAFDPVGRYVMLIPTALCVGNGLGAAIGGALMESFGAGHAFAFAAGCCALSAAAFARLGRRAAPDAPSAG